MNKHTTSVKQPYGCKYSNSITQRKSFIKRKCQITFHFKRPSQPNANYNGSCLIMIVKLLMKSVKDRRARVQILFILNLELPVQHSSYIYFILIWWAYWEL